MTKLSLYTATCFSFLTGLSLLATPVQAKNLANCTLGTPCVLGETGTAQYSVTPDSGVNYTCVVTADDAEATLQFLVKSAGQYRLIEGGGIHEAAPTVTLEITGKFKKEKPNTKGKLMFMNLVGIPGKVTCSPTAPSIK